MQSEKLSYILKHLLQEQHKNIQKVRLAYRCTIWNIHDEQLVYFSSMARIPNKIGSTSTFSGEKSLTSKKSSPCQPLWTFTHSLKIILLTPETSQWFCEDPTAGPGPNRGTMPPWLCQWSIYNRYVYSYTENSRTMKDASESPGINNHCSFQDWAKVDACQEGEH